MLATWNANGPTLNASDPARGMCAEKLALIREALDGLREAKHRIVRMNAVDVEVDPEAVDHRTFAPGAISSATPSGPPAPFAIFASASRAMLLGPESHAVLTRRAGGSRNLNGSGLRGRLRGDGIDGA